MLLYISWLDSTSDTREVSGSSPEGSTIYSGIAQLARAVDSYPTGRKFEPYYRYQILLTYSSGRRGRFAKPLGRVIGAEVQILQ